MRTSFYLLAGVLLGRTAHSQRLSYNDSIQALAYGNIATSSVESSSDVWLNITGFAETELPHIQTDVGIHSLDNARELQVIANMVQSAAREGLWGDLVFLYNIFSMNAYPAYANVAMRGKGSPGSGPDKRLIELYASTSSAPGLEAAYRALPAQYNTQQQQQQQQQQNQAATSPLVAVEPTSTTAAVDKRAADWDRNQIVCSAAHVAVGAACIALPRDICYQGCCISWSANATFQIENLYNDAQRCYNVCLNASGGVSCEAYNVSLQGTIDNQCLSNRPNGCA
ncbi:hypothetical protein BDV24DRAFT_149087 [Aspergillus arachidicola]|uniref:WD-like domain-containing protein n=1 Tax=Aspergillus arachidicola TaxID=656916 RepID=A0A5N6YKU6_9EURO|nr:hypothetical protein BDV24DRAFT_149087 [Aspergillus arachidicola]